MSRRLTTREKVLLTILAFILLALLYYMVVWKNVNETITDAQLRIEAAQSQLMLEQAKYDQMVAMQEELDAYFANPGSQSYEVPEYDNVETLFYTLQRTLSVTSCTGYELSFPTIGADGNLVRRGMNLVFTAVDYQAAKRIITNINNGPYRCHIGDIAITGQSGDFSTGAVKVSMQVTYYEFAEGGIVVEQVE